MLSPHTLVQQGNMPGHDSIRMGGGLSAKITSLEEREREPKATTYTKNWIIINTALLNNFKFVKNMTQKTPKASFGGRHSQLFLSVHDRLSGLHFQPVWISNCQHSVAGCVGCPIPKTC